MVSSFGGLCRELWDNQLTGTVPTELGAMSRMTLMYVAPHLLQQQSMNLKHLMPFHNWLLLHRVRGAMASAVSGRCSFNNSIMLMHSYYFTFYHEFLCIAYIYSNIWSIFIHKVSLSS